MTVTDADGHSSSNSSNPLTVNYSNSPPADLALNLESIDNQRRRPGVTPAAALPTCKRTLRTR